MKRILEPELMNEPEQVLAYAQADFEEPHSQFITEFIHRFGDYPGPTHVLDLGCGPADISIRFARAFPECTLLAVDGAENMLDLARQAIQQAGLVDRIELRQACLPDLSLQTKAFDTIISNSLLHHLHDPGVLWDTIREVTQGGTRVFIMDLRRPAEITDVEKLVEAYASNEPAVLKRDFYHSLCAAFTPNEIMEQLKEYNFTNLKVEMISDRHLVVSGVV